MTTTKCQMKWIIAHSKEGIEYTKTVKGFEWIGLSFWEI